ncbi:hypothetical protein [Caballeronia sp. DA-9]|uniref:hypothetical protein n=1 Tax=Caballeronia sp. DA-9 TaxID=3436237 RepID=UPI003F669247
MPEAVFSPMLQWFAALLFLPKLQNRVIFYSHAPGSAGGISASASMGKGVRVYLQVGIDHACGEHPRRSEPLISLSSDFAFAF